LSNTHSQKRKRNRSRGQSLVELALLLPVMVLVFTSAIDFARVYETKIRLESATRDAAEFAASDINPLTVSDPTAAARRIVCLQFVPSNPTCTEPRVVVTRTTNSSASVGGTTLYPMVKAIVESKVDFSTFMPYPLVTNSGILELTAKSEYSVLWGR